MQTIDRKILIVAAVALIDVDGRILISKRPDNKYFLNNDKDKITCLGTNQFN